MFFQSAVGLLRLAGILEGISYLVLLLIAMPLKYYLNLPLAVTIVGAVHGGLFVFYFIKVVYVKIRKKWSFGWGCWAVFLAFIPFGTFYLDTQLRKTLS